jgi:hypothetical protein
MSCLDEGGIVAKLSSAYISALMFLAKVMVRLTCRCLCMVESWHLLAAGGPCYLGVQPGCPGGS